MSEVQYALRVDVYHGLRDQLRSWLDANCVAWIVAHEDPAGNPHLHAILHSSKKEQALRSSFVRGCPGVSGNKSYSLKKCDDDVDAYIRYICKGHDSTTPPLIWFRQGLDYTEEVIASAHGQYWVNNAALVANAKKRQKVDGGNVVEQIEKICKSRGYKSHERKEIAGVYLEVFRDARKGINVFAARAVVNTVCLLLERPEPQFQQLAIKIAEL